MNRDEYASIHDGYRAGCVFCRPAPALVVDTTANFRVCFDVAPLTPGHLIIHSHEHYGCAGEVPEPLFDEFLAVRGATLAKLRRVYGSVTLYEHGRAGHCLSDGPEHRLCHHFHLHCVPGHFDVGAELARRFQHRRMAAHTEIVELYEQHGPYLYLETGDGEMTYFSVSEDIERHLMRTLIARHLRAPERADWRQYRAPDLLTQGMRGLRHAARGEPRPGERPDPAPELRTARAGTNRVPDGREC